MSSYRNRRVRAQRKRHSRTVAQLKDRIRTFEEQGRKKEAKVAQDRLLKLLLGAVHAAHVRPHTRRITLKDGTTKDVEVSSYTLKHTYHHRSVLLSASHRRHPSWRSRTRKSTASTPSARLGRGRRWAALAGRAGREVLLRHGQRRRRLCAAGRRSVPRRGWRVVVRPARRAMRFGSGRRQFGAVRSRVLFLGVLARVLAGQRAVWSVRDGGRGDRGGARALGLRLIRPPRPDPRRNLPDLPVPVGALRHVVRERSRERLVVVTNSVGDVGRFVDGGGVEPLEIRVLRWQPDLRYGPARP